MPQACLHLPEYGERMSIKGIIFDFDGTLFDSMSIWETAGTDYLTSLGRTAEKDLDKTLKTMSLLQSAEYLKAHYNLPFSAAAVMEGVNAIVEDFYLYRAMPKDHVISLLSVFQSNGIKMCIATATDRYQVEAALDRCNMLDCFDAIFTCSEVGHGKDEPDIFEIACKAMGLDRSEVIVFEDAYHAAKTAKDAGFYVVGVYDQYEKRTTGLKALADLYISSFSETDKLLPMAKRCGNTKGELQHENENGIDRCRQ